MIFLALFFVSVCQAFEGNYSIVNTSEIRSLAPTSWNPSNRILKLPTVFRQLELRADLGLGFDRFELKARPRISGEFSRVNEKNEAEADLFATELFLKANLSDEVFISLGRVQFGWGPAESVSPTNEFAPDFQWQASPNYEQLGVTRGQGNLTLGQGLSVIFAHELKALPDNWRSRSWSEPYLGRWFFKSEYSWDSGAKSVGILFGRNKTLGYRVGGYGSWTLSDAWQLLGDVVIREKFDIWKPFGVVGLRYTFENGSELKLEGIYNGWGARNFSTIDATVLPDTVLQAQFASQTLPGRSYSYLSWSWPNLPGLPSWVQRPLVQLRWMHSLADHSSSLVGLFEGGLGEQLVAGLYGGLSQGSTGAELRQAHDGLIGLTVKFTF